MSAQGKAFPGGAGLGGTSAGAAAAAAASVRGNHASSQVQQLQQGGMLVGGAAIGPSALVVTAPLPMLAGAHCLVLMFYLLSTVCDCSCRQPAKGSS